METTDDVTSALQSLQNRIEDLEIRVGEVLTKQLEMKQELNLIKEIPENIEDSQEDEKADIQLPDDYKFTEDLQKILESMIASQKTWLESVKTAKQLKTGLEGLQIFKEMNKHLSDRLEYLEMAKTLIEGPLLKEPPPPPVEEIPAEEPKTDEKGKGKKGKGKKGAPKKGKK